MAVGEARDVLVFKAGADAAADYAAVHADVFSAAWDAQSFRGLLGQPATVGFLAGFARPAQTAGFIVGQVAAGEAEILTLGVRAERRRLGIATRLIEALASAARTAHADSLFLEVDAGNTAALALYGKLGFQERGRRKAYYVRANASPADAVTLQRTL
jgi:ribosomal-protein-alanine N-acetyltransferase